MRRVLTSETRSAFFVMRALCAVTAIGLGLGLFSGPKAFAFIPEVDRTLEAIAEVNRVSERTTAIKLNLTMRIGGRAPIASGELISHPSGLARLELRGYGGRTDRYLLSGNELLAAKGGRRLDRPQPMLQPFFLLQPDSATTLRAALETFGVRTEWIGLAPCGEQDCFVIGDSRLAAPLPPPPVDPSADAQTALGDPLAAVDTEAGSDQGARGDRPSVRASADDRLSGPVLDLPEDGMIPRIWVDTRELQVRRIDRRNGVYTLFGPMVSFDKLKVPGWFEIHEPGAPTIRFDVHRAVQVNAPPQAFSRKWLLAVDDRSSSRTEPGEMREAVADPDSSGIR